MKKDWSMNGHNNLANNRSWKPVVLKNIKFLFSLSQNMFNHDNYLTTVDVLNNSFNFKIT